MQLAQVSAALHWIFSCICQGNCSVFCDRMLNGCRFILLPLESVGL